MKLLRIYVECLDCGKVWESKNAHGVGAKHHQQTGHTVVVEKSYGMVYKIGKAILEVEDGNA